MRIILFLAIALLCSLLSLTSALQAQEPTFPQTEEEIVRALEYKQGQEGVGHTRSLGGSHRGPAGTVQAPKALALIHFDYDSARIRPESFPLLDNYGRALTGELSQAELTIVGHTDATGAEEYNRELSLRRASAVQEYLAANFGISQQRLKVQGMGMSSPIADNDTDQGRARNRRVEFIRTGDAY
jgi:outer membrane protein OmpA-like peptidoglycan-associated protein